MDRFRALRYFKRTVELSSFSAAAKELDVPASSISRRIKDIEVELGIELLQRTTRNVSTTELGQVYYEMVVEILQNLSDADELISQRRDAFEGKIRISATPSFGRKILAPIMQDFRKQYPNIILDLNFSDELTVLGRDAVDIAIRAGNVPNERVIAKKLSDAEFKLVATPRLLDTLQTKFGRSELSIEDLKTSPTLQYKGKHGALTWWHQREGNWEPTDITPIFWCNNGETLLEATLAGEGLSLFPLWWVNSYLTSGKLVEVPVNMPISNRQTQSYDVYILYQQAKYQIPKIKHCVDFIIKHVRES
ncbi:LysR family transcriptional regulator [Vibrio sp. HN007]|uniref:LysR family transcriptional regulator n=1 Tax=Vibrio iocasae TaxID=3098914 RepID=UPI0035D3F47D